MAKANRSRKGAKNDDRGRRTDDNFELTALNDFTEGNDDN